MSSQAGSMPIFRITSNKHAFRPDPASGYLECERCQLPAANDRHHRTTSGETFVVVQDDTLTRGRLVALELAALTRWRHDPERLRAFVSENVSRLRVAA